MVVITCQERSRNLVQNTLEIHQQLLFLGTSYHNKYNDGPLTKTVIVASLPSDVVTTLDSVWVRPEGTGGPVTKHESAAMIRITYGFS